MFLFSLTRWKFRDQYCCCYLFCFSARDVGNSVINVVVALFCFVFVFLPHTLEIPSSVLSLLFCFVFSSSHVGNSVISVVVVILFFSLTRWKFRHQCCYFVFFFSLTRLKFRDQCFIVVTLFCVFFPSNVGNPVIIVDIILFFSLKRWKFRYHFVFSPSLLGNSVISVLLLLLLLCFLLLFLSSLACWKFYNQCCCHFFPPHTLEIPS